MNDREDGHYVVEYKPQVIDTDTHTQHRGTALLF